MDTTLFAIAFVCIVIAAVAVYYFILTNKLKNTEQQLSLIEKQFSVYRAKTDHLIQYEAIDDAKAEAQRVFSKAERESQLAISKAERESQSAILKMRQHIESEMKAAADSIKNIRAKAKEIERKSEWKVTESIKTATEIEDSAHLKAKEIAGEAWEAKQNADQYVATVEAMKNIIKGYGDEYLISARTHLDELAGEYDHKEAGQALARIRTQIKSMIKTEAAAECDYAEKHRKQTAIAFVLDAFNGKVDSLMSNVKHDNYGKLLQQLEDAFRIVNHNGKAFRNARIVQAYYDTMVQQLKMAVATQELKRIDMEEQRRIKQEMREEERAHREFEKARKEAEKEERMLLKAMKEAQAQLANAAASERSKFELQLAELSQKLTEAESKGQRAMSMAQQTRQGHVYVISNVGSFGEDVFKIGLTRRLEPLDRVKELGDASVPFSFDVHAMIHSEDAPKLEKDLHLIFGDHQVNKVNSRKEFFRVPLSSIKQKVSEMGVAGNALWTMKAEASEYRESIQMRKDT